ncbi:MAG: amino acid permease [Flavipsychrobacter sp.]|nr:amino acid permease [Flavipsychrobacter sp.]
MAENIFRRKTVAQIEREAASGLTDGHGTPGMHRVLGVRDLTFMGIAAIVGAGIFSAIGKAAYDGGPGIILLFVIVSIACGFSALCYAEFASMVPVAGSAYTYSYVAFGEVIAWIIGWDLLMEYAIGNIAVAISWSDYFTSLVNSIKIGGTQLHIPDYLTMDYWTAKEMGSEAAKAAWNNAPTLGSLKFICDLPAFLITVVITWIIFIGIKESRKATNFMVIFKMVIIAVVIIAGAFYVQPENWTPFLPKGMSGVMMGTAAVFFSYIGFDAISTTAEECKNPQRDLPKAMFNSLIICTVLYIVIALVLTGMVPSSQLNVGDPLAYVFHAVNMDKLAGVISVSAVIATASVLLVFQLGQPRIWMSMSRDGLLPPIFSRIHPKYKTPSFSTILTGVLVGIPSLFLNLSMVIDLTSVGTLFAFVLVCGGIIRLQQQRKKGAHLPGADVIEEHGTPAVVPVSKFKIPYVNARYVVPALFVLTVVLFVMLGDGSFFRFTDDAGNVTWAVLRTKVPYLLFALVFAVTAVFSFLHHYSLIPVLGFLSCSYLLCESGTTNWERFLVWLAIGLAIYFLYGKQHSKLGRQ